MATMKIMTASTPIKPAIRLRWIESWPSVAPIVRMSATLSGTGRAPYCICTPSDSASSRVNCPVMTPWSRMAALMTGAESTTPSSTIAMGWPMWVLVKL